MVLLNHRLARLALVLGLCAAGAAYSAAQLPPAAAIAPEEPTELAAAVERAFPQADEIRVRVANLDDALRAALSGRLRNQRAPRLWSYREARLKGELVGRAVVGDVLGKSLPITYLLVLSPANRVLAVEVLTYRESHGGEVRREAWRAQFVGRGVQDPLRLGTDIKNIAGATLSCRALTDAVHDGLEIAQAVFEVPQNSTPPRPATPATPASAAAAWRGERDAAVMERTQLLMGTLLTLRASGADRAQFDAAADAGFARVAALESLWSSWRDDSEISLLNDAPTGIWCGLDPASVELLQHAEGLRARTGAAFAIESGALVALWQRAERDQALPTDEKLAAARDAAGSAAFEFDFERARARRNTDLARLDLGAIGKGAALDAVAREFRARGLTRALFDFGGQLLALDGPRAGAGWPVAVRDPRPGAVAALWELELEHASLATAADDQRGLLIRGERLSHIVDPRSGRPAGLAWTCCALAANATDADAWSTAGFVLGHAAGNERAAPHGIRLLTLGRDGNLQASTAFPGHGFPP